jgi:hypothetical protein
MAFGHVGRRLDHDRFPAQLEEGFFGARFAMTFVFRSSD